MRKNKILQATGFKIVTIVICIVTTALILSQFALLIQQLITIKYDWLFELFMVIGMMLFSIPSFIKKPVCRN